MPFAFSILLLILGTVSVRAENLEIESVGTYGKWVFEISNKKTAKIVRYEEFEKTDELIIPSNIEGFPVVEIGEDVFFTNSMSHVTIPIGIESIGTGAFFGCSNLTIVDIPDGVTSIGENAFRSCTNLKEVWLPNSMEGRGIWSSSFEKCSKDFHFVIARNAGTLITYLKRSSYEYVFCDYYFSVLDDGSAEITRFVREENDGWTAEEELYARRQKRNISIPSHMFGHPVTSIGSEAFSQCDEIVSLTLPETLKFIGEKAFAGISASRIIVPEGVVKIENGAFYGCSGVTITLPSSLETINGNPFIGCSNYEPLNVVLSPLNYNYEIRSDFLISKDNKIISYLGCNSDEIIIPDGINSIGAYAFAASSSIKKVLIPRSVQQIEDHAFSSCKKLESIEIEEGVQIIQNSVFENCCNLVAANIPSTIVQLGDDVFKGCTQLALVTDDTYDLTLVNYTYSKDDHRIIKYEGSKYVDEVVLPKDTEIIGEFAFSWCDYIKSIIISEKVTTIENCAFQLCTSLTSVYIPESVTYISPTAFNHCNLHPGDNNSIYAVAGAPSWELEKIPVKNTYIVFKVIEGSYAHHFCVENNYEYELIANETSQKRDNEKIMQYPKDLISATVQVVPATPTPTSIAQTTPMSTAITYTTYEAVCLLQQRLQELGYYSATIDGYYGIKTRQAVENFQKDNGLTIDGVAENIPQHLLYEGTSAVSDSKATSKPSTNSQITNSVKRGDIISLGNYKSEEINWYVVEIDQSEDTALLVSVSAVDVVKYHTSTATTTWANSYLRNWLDNSFYQTAFTNSEKNYIQTSIVEGSEDKVYILSEEEVRKYLSYMGNTWLLYATNSCYKGNTDTGIKIYKNSSSGGSSWWLRTSTTGTSASVVGGKGVDPSINPVNNGPTSRDNGVRPAIKVSLSLFRVTAQ